MKRMEIKYVECELCGKMFPDHIRTDIEIAYGIYICQECINKICSNAIRENILE